MIYILIPPPGSGFHNLHPNPPPSWRGENTFPLVWGYHTHTQTHTHTHTFHARNWMYGVIYIYILYLIHIRSKKGGRVDNVWYPQTKAKVFPPLQGGKGGSGVNYKTHAPGGVLGYISFPYMIITLLGFWLPWKNHILSGYMIWEGLSFLNPSSKW